nr:MAG TPA: Cell wall hydrolase autolysin [Caudoviricetes sp.]
MKVFLNPGHAPNGNPDPGAVNEETGLRECDVALAVGKSAESYLNAAGVETELLQSDSLYDICEAANNSDANIFVSIHCNAAEVEAANGTETWACAGSYRGSMLAGCIQSQLVDALDTTDRGVKIATPGVNGLYVLTNTNMPAVLVELAFITNPSDEEILANAKDAMARAVARGITDYELLIYGGK